MRRAPIVVLLLVVVAALAIWVFRPDAGSAPHSGTTGTEETSAAVAPASPLSPAAAATPDAPERQDVSADPAGPSLAVQVVALANGAPVAGAMVLYQPPDFDWAKLAPPMAEELERLARDPEDLLERVGCAVMTDAEGRCRIPGPGPQGMIVVARSGELYGIGYPQPNDTAELRLVVRPDRTLRVRVVDRNGAGAARIPVIAERAEQQASRNVGRWHVGISDAEGRIVINHAQGFAGEAASCVASFTAHAPGQPGPAVLADFAAPPPEVVLQLPPTGSATVRVLDSDGTPVDPRYFDPATVSLAAFERRPQNRREEIDGFRVGQAADAPLDPGGVATFAHVALGRFLCVRFGHSFDVLGFAGPTFEQPHVEATIRRPAGAMGLAGRVLDLDGAPLVERRLVISYQHAGSRGSSGCRTDAEGRFRHFLQGNRPGEATTVRVGTHTSERQNPMAVELAPLTLQPGTNDLGDVQLQPFRVLLAGRIVRDAGIDAARSPAIEVERYDGRTWQQDWELRPEWPSADRFEVRGVCADGVALRLVVREGDWLPVAPIECKVPARDLEVRLAAAGSVTATFLVEETLPADRLQFRLMRTEPPEQPDPRAEMLERISHLGSLPSPDGKLQRAWQGLTAGTYRLTVVCPGADEPVFRLDDLRVGSGPCNDPRLLSIDLRGSLRTLLVRATYADGKPIQDRNAFVLPICKGDSWQGFHLASGVVELVVPRQIDLLVFAPGHRIGRATAVSADCTVALERAVPAQIMVTLPQALPQGVSLSLVLLPRQDLPARATVQLDTGRGTGLDQFFAETALVGANGVATVLVRFPGKHEVTGKLNDRWMLYGFEPRSVELAPEGGSIAVQVHAKALADTLQRMSK